MKIILDENLPHPLKDAFGKACAVTTVQEVGLSGVENGALLALLEGAYDVFVTADKNLRYQQNLAGRALAIVELPTNRLPLLFPLYAQIERAVENAMAGSYVVQPVNDAAPG